MLSAQLTQQLESIQSLQETLEEETTCLKEKSFSQLNAILFKKKKLLQEIAALDKVLSTAASQNKITENEDLLTLKNKIEVQLANCQKINDINGRLVELSMKSNKQLGFKIGILIENALYIKILKNRSFAVKNIK